MIRRLFSFRNYVLFWALIGHFGAAYFVVKVAYPHRQQVISLMYEYLYFDSSKPVPLSEVMAFWQQKIQPQLLQSVTEPNALRVITVADTSKFRRAIKNAKPGDHIVLGPGTFKLSGKYLKFSNAGSAELPITLSASKAWTTRIEMNMSEGFYIEAPYWRIQGVELVGTCATDRKCEHAFHIVGEGHHTQLIGNRISGFNSHIKANPKDGKWPDDALIVGNSFVNPAPRKTRSPVTLIDVVAASGWQVRNNFIANFKKDGSDYTSYAAFFKGAGRNNSFESNVVLCSENKNPKFTQVGLSFGGGGTNTRVCRDQQCLYEHDEGVIQGNVVANCSDVGIYLNKSNNTLVSNNTLYNTLGIDVRFPESTAVVINNLFSGRLKERNGGTVKFSSNNWELPVDSTFGDSFATLFSAAHRLDFSLKSSRPEIPEAIENKRMNKDLCGKGSLSNHLYIGAFDYHLRQNCLLSY
ncbi:hypothetical protein DV711_04335 [Motiliproteus coralliicola]|uniref:Right-handed parallel beta-helix repeat-containing protein n=1 Tax=Motiliproteus coralliicola TaxID=2283196 RepID=A0A369WUS5_9GAMM|nr:chondroitinase-B domain-containing protein [Motiliproteus coralliicola]RDE24819.1 hypothetical protein DV711_04335 [Motiliproteus coralliicola]